MSKASKIRDKDTIAVYSTDPYQPGIADMLLEANEAPAARTFSSLEEYRAWVNSLPSV